MAPPTPARPANRLTFSALRQEITQRYGPLIIELEEGAEPAVFAPVLRLDEETREAFYQLIDQLSAVQRDPAAADDADATADVAESVAGTDDQVRRVGEAFARVQQQVELIQQLLGIVGGDGSLDRLTAAMQASGDDDPGAWLYVWERYMEVSQPGEAGPSGT